ncbi:hypothetical protein D5b_00229 [Faustovirus]|nr:hypothetical protein D5b_00229 [Faustovirus]AMN84685.1 hypothetical protein D6_00282 [Faustovirus]
MAHSKPIRKEFVYKSKHVDEEEEMIKSWGIVNPNDIKYKLMRKIRWLKYNKIRDVNALSHDTCANRHYIYNFAKKTNKSNEHVCEFIERVEPVVNWYITQNVNKVFEIADAMTLAHRSGGNVYYPFVNIIDLYEEMFIIGCVVRPPQTTSTAYITLPENPVMLIKAPYHPRIKLNGERIKEIKKNHIAPGRYYAQNVVNLEIPVSIAATYAGEYRVKSTDNMKTVANDISGVIKNAFDAYPMRNDFAIKINIQYVAATSLELPIDPTLPVILPEPEPEPEPAYSPAPTPLPYNNNNYQAAYQQIYQDPSGANIIYIPYIVNYPFNQGNAPIVIDSPSCESINNTNQSVDLNESIDSNESNPCNDSIDSIEATATINSDEVYDFSTTIIDDVFGVDDAFILP